MGSCPKRGPLGSEIRGVDERALSGWQYYEKLKQMHKYSADVEPFYQDTTKKFITLFKVRK